jgi:hypothetical protein
MAPCRREEKCSWEGFVCLQPFKLCLTFSDAYSDDLKKLFIPQQQSVVIFIKAQERTTFVGSRDQEALRFGKFCLGRKEDRMRSLVAKLVEGLRARVHKAARVPDIMYTLLPWAKNGSAQTLVRSNISIVAVG